MSPHPWFDSTIHNPELDAGEAETMLFALDRSRVQFAWKCGGLDETALRRAHPPSAMTLGGLLFHLALVEDWRTTNVTGGDMPALWGGYDPDTEWSAAGELTADELYGRWSDAVKRSRAAWAEALGQGGLDQPAAWVLPDGSSPNLRRIIVDLHDEYARHVGHADLMREAIDGVVGEDPPPAG